MAQRASARLIFLVLGGLALVAWGAGYFYLSSLACAFGGPQTACSIPLPWALGREDLWVMVIGPGAVTVALFAAAWIVGRRA